MMRRMTKFIDKQVTDLRQPTLAPVNFTVTPDMISQSENVDIMKEYMKEIIKAMKKQAKATEIDITRNVQLSEIFDAFSKACSERNATSQTGACLRDAAAFVQRLNDLIAKMEEKVQQVLCTTIETFVTDGLKPAIEKKKQYDREAMDYDGMITKHKSLKKTGKATPQKEKESEQQLSDTKDGYLATEKETLELLQQASMKGEALTIVKIVEYWDSLNAYFKEGVKFCETMQPKIDKYRKHIRDMARPATLSKKNRVFKQALSTICEREQRRVPQVIVACCNYLSVHGLDTQGIFRVSPTKDSLDDLKSEVDSGRTYDFSDITSPHVVSGMLKAFFREMPDPIFTFERYPKFMEASKLPTPEAQIAAIAKLLKSLPLSNYKSLQHVSLLCIKIDEKKEENKMTISNLATVLTPNLLYTTTMDAMTMVQEMEQANRVYSLIVENYSTMFPEDDLDIDVLIYAPTPSSEAGAGAIAGSSGAATAGSDISPASSVPKISTDGRSLLSSSAPSSPSPLDDDYSVEEPVTKPSKRKSKMSASLKLESVSSSPEKGLESDGDTESARKKPKSARSKRILREKSESASSSAREAAMKAELQEGTEGSSPAPSPGRGSSSSLSAVEALRRTVSHRVTLTDSSSSLGGGDDSEGGSISDLKSSPSSPSIEIKRRKKKMSVSVTTELGAIERDVSPREPVTPTKSPRGGSSSVESETPRSPESRSSRTESGSSATLPSPKTKSKDKEEIITTTPPSVIISATEEIKASETSAVTTGPEASPETKLEPAATNTATEETIAVGTEESSTTKTDTEAETPKVEDEKPVEPPVENVEESQEAAVESKEDSSEPSPVAVPTEPTVLEAPPVEPEPPVVAEDVKTPPETPVIIAAPVPAKAEYGEEINSPTESNVSAPPPVIATPPASSSSSTPESAPSSPEQQDTEVESILDNLSAISKRLSTKPDPIDDPVPPVLPEPCELLLPLMDPTLQGLVDALFTFAQTGNAAEVDIATLSQCTRELAVQAKALSSASAEMAANFPESETEIAETIDELPALLRNVVIGVKGVSGSPGDPNALAELNSSVASYAKAVKQLTHYMSVSSVQQLFATAQATVPKVAAQIASFVKSVLTEGIDASSLDDQKVTLSKDLHHLLSLTGMIASQVLHPELADELESTLVAVDSSYNKFWAVVTSSTTDEAPPDLGPALIQETKTIVSNLRELEPLLQRFQEESRAEIPVDADRIRTALRDCLDDLSNRIEYGSTSDLTVRLLIAGSKRSLKSFISRTRAFSSFQGLNTPDGLTAQAEYAEAVTRLLFYIKYHRIESDGQAPMTLANASGAMLELTRSRIAAVLAVTESDFTDHTSKLLAIVLRITQSLSRAIFG